MPGMNGPELAKEVISLFPDIICLFMSGYTGNVIVHHGVLEQGFNFIEKPFSMQKLATKLRELLDSK
jgi:two-component system, cell cycle sensor histidine kinase and response regulator CckA